MKEDFASIDKISTPITVLTEGYLDTRHAKTATGVMRYGKWPIASVIDSKFAGKVVQDLVPDLNCQAPIVSSIEAALKQAIKPKALLVGVAPVGGQLPESWLQIIETAITSGLDVISGLHEFLNDNDRLRQLAQQYKVKLWDLRDPRLFTASKEQRVAKQDKRLAFNKVITMVGSDCNVGKMCVALELRNRMNNLGKISDFIATGQTGIMIEGDGIPLDRIISDFAAGAMESAIENSIKKNNPEYIFVEGQGSLLHPGYSGVTLSLLHGSNPNMMILCTKAVNKTILNYQIIIPSLTKLIEIYESAHSWIGHPNNHLARVVGVAINTSGLGLEEAKDLINKAKQETGLPVTDIYRFGVDEIISKIISWN